MQVIESKAFRLSCRGVPTRLAEHSDQLLEIQRLHERLLRQVLLRGDARHSRRALLPLARIQQLDLLDPASCRLSSAMLRPGQTLAAHCRTCCSSDTPSMQLTACPRILSSVQ